MQKLALISVYDKSNIVDFAKELNNQNFLILATGKTAKILAENNIECKEISEFTLFPEVFEGRVKTLHPKVFGGILFRRNNLEDKKQAEENNILPIDIVCVNLYPFPQLVNRTEISLDEKIENIDIGGPSLIRAAAKNYNFVSVLTNPLQYDNFLSELRSGEISIETRRKLALDAFSYTSYYDTLIANFFNKEFNLTTNEIRINYQSPIQLRYGENPHQKAFLYGEFENYFEILHGKELSYNNLIDLTSAVELISEFEETTCAIIKHTNPCGAAIGKDTLDSFKRALKCDPVSAFGGIVVFNREIDKQTAEELNNIFLEIVCAPSFAEEALNILSVKKNRRLVIIKNFPSPDELLLKSIPGGILAQTKDNSKFDEKSIQTVTSRKLTKVELDDLKFAWSVCKHTKSNAIVIVKDKMAIGVGAGQMSRIDSVKIAFEKAIQFGHNMVGAVAASDAFFPFADGVVEIASRGITAIVQPGGSVRDEEVIKAANDKNISMVFTGIRNFKH